MSLCTWALRALALLALGAASAVPGAAQSGDAPRWVSVLSTDYPFLDAHDLAVGPGGPLAVGGASDELRVSGGVGAGAAFDLGPRGLNGGEFSFVFATTPDGGPRWARPASTDGAPFETYHVAAEGDRVVTGEGLWYQPEPYRWAVGSTTLVGRSTADGAVDWAYPLGRPLPGEIQSSAVAYGVELVDGVVYAAGVFRDTLVVGADTLAVDGEGGEPYGEWFDTFVLALDGATGAPLWARSVAIAQDDRDPLLRAVGFNARLGHAAFGVGDGVFLAGTFPAGARVGRGVGDPGAVALGAETALLRFGPDGGFGRPWTALELGVNADLPDPTDPTNPNIRFEARPYRLATGPGRPVALAWSFIRYSNGTGPTDAAYVEAGGVLYRSPEHGRGRAGTLVTSHGPDGAFGWAVALAGNGFPLAWSLDVDRAGRVAVGAESDSDVLSVGGVRVPREGRGDGFALVLGPGGGVQRLVHVADEGSPTSAETNAYQRVRAVAFDDGTTGTEAPGGTVYVAGRFRQSFEVDETVYAAETPERAALFVTRVDLDGVVSTDGGPAVAPLGLRAVPNPAGSAVRFQVEGAGGLVSATVVDVLGREVARLDRRPAGALVLDVSGLAPGLYAVRVESAGQTATRTITVAR